MEHSPTFVHDAVSMLRSSGSVAQEQDLGRADLPVTHASKISGSTNDPSCVPTALPKSHVDIFEPSLVKDFWKPQQPPRPGHFTGTPRQPMVNNIQEQGPVLHGSRTSKQLPVPNFERIRSTLDAAGKPLHLPDISLSDESEQNKTASSSRSSLFGHLQKVTDLPQPHSPKVGTLKATDTIARAFNEETGETRSPRTQALLATGDATVSPPVPSSPDHAFLSETLPAPRHVTQKQCAAVSLPENRHNSVPSNSMLTAPYLLYRASPASTCGDLEGPVHHTPRTRTRLFDKYIPNHGSGISQSPLSQRYEARHRSRSRTSNISKKRTGALKGSSRNRHNPERKRTAMFEVARHWNECMRIAEEEKSQASQEIERLQHGLRQQESELRKFQSMLKSKNDTIRDLETRCEDTEERLQETQSKSASLETRVVSLQNEVTDAKQRSTSLADKYRTYKSKLNEAIVEQQQLFTSSSNFYKEMMNELQEWSNTQKSELDSIRTALDESQTRHEGIKKSLQEMRGEMAQQKHEHHATVSALRQQVKDYEHTVSHERNLNTSLQQQVETQSSQAHGEQSLKSKLDALLEVCTSSHYQLVTNVNNDLLLRNQLDLVMEDITSPAHQMPDSSKLEEMLSTYREDIISRLLPAISKAVGKQEDTAQLVNDIRVDMSSGFESLGERICSELAQNPMTAESEPGRDEQLGSFVDKVLEDMRATRADYGRLQQALEARTQCEQKQSEVQHVERNDLILQVQQRESRISDLENQLQLATEDYARQVEGMRVTIQDNDETSKKQLRALAEELRRGLEGGIQKEKELFERTLRESEAAKERLEADLQQAKEQLESYPPENTNVLRVSLQHEQESAARLTQRVLDLEKESESRRELGARWQQDINAIENLRTKLTAAFERVPGLESFGAQLNRIAEMNNYITSTATFMRSEGSWIQEQLQVQLPERAQSNAGETTSMNTKAVEAVNNQNNASVEAKPRSSESFRSQIAKQVYGIESTISVDDLARRRVVVQSPCIDANTPSPPLSIEQEQRRRREGARTRPILKPLGVQALGLTESQESVLRVAHHHSQYNRPVIGGISKAASQKGSRVLPVAATDGNHKVVEQIRAGLVQHKRPARNWDLPTVADFERCHQPSQESASVQTREGSSMDRADEPPVKRSKLNDGELSKSAGLTDHGIASSQPLPEAYTQRPITRNYSRHLSVQ
ncbi:hypothetical protein HJFPF1_08912 [Paramyrothecium foliicola]|nr:hypothetical protein HJFPF1_08912 [Paramyrothecium foliicola]